MVKRRRVDQPAAVFLQTRRMVRAARRTHSARVVPARANARPRPISGHV
jgi:hypothetical protein